MENKVVPVKELVKNKKMAEVTKFFDTTVRQIFHDHLGMHKDSARWVAKHYTQNYQRKTE